MENSLEKKRFGRSGKIAIAAAAAVLAAGASVYAVNAANSISETEAKQIALGQVSGADNSHITKCVRDFDDGREEYDVEIVFNGYEYDFEISARDGRIYDQNREALDRDDLEAHVAADGQFAGGSESGSADDRQDGSASGAVVVSPTPPSSAYAGASSDIGLEQAKSIALEQVPGAAYESIRKAHSDYDDGRLEYEIEIRHNGYEYDFEIDGVNGQIISKDAERMDHDDYYDYD